MEGDNAAALGIERVSTGTDPLRIDDDFLSIPTSGHTRGHQVLLYRNKILFTGDHLAWSPERNTLIAAKGIVSGFAAAAAATGSISGTVVVAFAAALVPIPGATLTLTDSGGATRNTVSALRKRLERARSLLSSPSGR